MGYEQIVEAVAIEVADKAGYGPQASSCKGQARQGQKAGKVRDVVRPRVESDQAVAEGQQLRGLLAGRSNQRIAVVEKAKPQSRQQKDVIRLRVGNEDVGNAVQRLVADKRLNRPAAGLQSRTIHERPARAGRLAEEDRQVVRALVGNDQVRPAVPVEVLRGNPDGPRTGKE